MNHDSYQHLDLLRKRLLKDNNKKKTDLNEINYKIMEVSYQREIFSFS